jgi:hypothetical protein
VRKLRVDKWRILDEKVESGLISDSELHGGIPRLCRLRILSVRPCGTSIDYVRIRDFWDPANLVASAVAELDDPSPLLQ